MKFENACLLRNVIHAICSWLQLIAQPATLANKRHFQLSLAPVRYQSFCYVYNKVPEQRQCDTYRIILTDAGWRSWLLQVCANLTSESELVYSVRMLSLLLSWARAPVSNWFETLSGKLFSIIWKVFHSHHMRIHVGHGAHARWYRHNALDSLSVAAVMLISRQLQWFHLYSPLLSSNSRTLCLSRRFTRTCRAKSYLTVANSGNFVKNCFLFSDLRLHKMTLR